MDDYREQIATIVLEAQVGGCTRYEAADRIIELLVGKLIELAGDALDELTEEMQ